MLQNLYAIPVYKTKLPDHEKVQQDFQDVIANDDNFDKVSSWYSNVDTTFGNPEANKLPFNAFIKNAILVLNKYITHFSVDAPLRYGVECWLNRYKKDYYQEVHNHAGRSVFSCAYMMNTPKNSGNFVFYKNTYDNLHASGLPLLSSEPFAYNNRITPPLEEGDIIFFPSTLEHYVTGNKTDNNRATISANFILELSENEEK
ncbi:MAG: hypothetical protein CMC89_01140 [Flavobacteriaceae bacterium]|nr:hypothetical protein [Flavobacteriaceae bacterium]